MKDKYLRSLKLELKAKKAKKKYVKALDKFYTSLKELRKDYDYFKDSEEIILEYLESNGIFIVEGEDANECEPERE